MKGNTILTSDRIGILAYIMTFFFSWSGKLSKLGSPEEWKNRIQKSIRELSEKSGVEIKSIRLKDAFRFELDKDFALKEDKILAVSQNRPHNLYYITSIIIFVMLHG